MRHFLNGVEIAPRNINDIGIVSDFTDNPDELQLNVDKVILPREAKTIIENHIASQGVFEGLPYTVETNAGIILEYYVDLTERAVFRSYEIEVKIKKRQGLDNFFERANGTTFNLMAFKGVDFQVFDVPYVIVKDNAVELGVSVAISLYVMTKELIQAVKDLADAIGDLVEAVTLSVGTGVVVPVGEIISLSIRVVAQLAYTIAVLVAVIKLAQQLLELIFPKVRNFKGSKVRTLIEKGCQFLGFNFESNLLNNISGLTILPVPLQPQPKRYFEFLQNDLNFAFNKGYPTSQDTTATLGELIKAVEDTFNARTRVINGTVQIERRDYWANVTPNSIVPALVLQDDRQDEYTLNTEEAWKRYFITYRVDYTDIHTADDYESTDAEYSTEPLSPINPDLVTIKGLNEVAIPFAMGRRKDNLNWIERLVKGLLQFIDSVANTFGGNSSFAATIDNRIGVLQISSQYFGTTKLLYTVAGKQPANYKDIIKAGALWNNYHYINQIQINDYLVRENVRARISDADFVNLLNNNFADVGGTVVEILRIEYIDDKSFAQITYKKPFDYADGTVETLVINE